MSHPMLQLCCEVWEFDKWTTKVVAVACDPTVFGVRRSWVGHTHVTQRELGLSFLLAV